jgi:hypothetical protein
MQNQKYNKLWTQLDLEFQTYKPDLEALSEVISPYRPKWLSSDNANGKNRTNKMLDSTGRLAANTMASGLMGGLTTESRPWFKLAVKQMETSSYAVRAWLDAATEKLRETFSRSNFYGRMPSFYTDLALGTALILEEEDDIDGVRFYVIPLGSYRIANGPRMTVDTMIREFVLTARQIVGRYGIDNASVSVKNAISMGNDELKFPCRQLICPNDKHRPGSPWANEKAFKSCVWEVGNDTALLSESGYDECPFFAVRWDTIGEDTLGIGPAHNAYPELLGLQVLRKIKSKAMEKTADPPMVIPTELAHSKFSLNPGGRIYHDGKDGRPQIYPAYMVNPDLSGMREDIQDQRRLVNQSFFADLFLMISNIDRSNTTAEEIRARQEEKLALLGPVMERINDEGLGPIIDRTFNILARKSAPYWMMGEDSPYLPRPPDEIQGQTIAIEYVSILAQAAKALSLTSVNRLIGQATQVAQLGDEAAQMVADTIDGAAILHESANQLGTKTTLLRSPEAVAQRQQARQQQAEQQAAIENAQRMAAGAKDLSQTNIDQSNALTALIG